MSPSLWPRSTLPDVECANNPNTLLVVTARGGHVAFLQGMWPFGTSFMDLAVMQFFQSVAQHLPRHHQEQQGKWAAADEVEGVERQQLRSKL